METEVANFPRLKNTRHSSTHGVTSLFYGQFFFLGKKQRLALVGLTVRETLQLGVRSSSDMTVV